MFISKRLSRKYILKGLHLPKLFFNNVIHLVIIVFIKHFHTGRHIIYSTFLQRFIYICYEVYFKEKCCLVLFHYFFFTLSFDVVIKVSGF